MTKKQFGIIFTLLALIVCTALLAAKLNEGGLNDPGDLSQVLSDENKNKDEEQDTETISQKDFFIDSRSEREHTDAKIVQNLKNIVENKNATDAQKVDASAELTKITKIQGQQSKIELNIKNKGYDDALCEITNDQSKANIIVKAPNGLSEKEGAIIQQIVQDASNIKDVSIEVKK
ncbi:SpoIIIAH-like family protein [Clostridium paraputrificum]|uniref:SpoIIIAH-like family protein n=1 Tax=Clostridium TaxID=1485 RepID=UPI003D33B92A